MKVKLISLSLAGALCLSALPLSQGTQTLTQQETAVLTASASDFRFSDGTITKYIGSDTNPVIPSSIDGETVTAIGTYAFNGADITSVVIPDTVVSIGSSAFSSCKNLVNVTLSKNLKHLGDAAFMSCTSLSNISLPSSLTTMDGAIFHGCTSLKSIVIPDSVIRIGNMVFEKCSSLTYVKLSANMTELPQQTFRDCTSLRSVVIPEGITLIHLLAFSNMTSLESLTLPSSLRSFAKDAFQNCTALKNVQYAGSLSSRNRLFIESGNDLLTRATWSYGVQDSTTTPSPLYTSSYFASIIHPSSFVVEELPTLRVGDTATLKSTLSPSNATFQTVVWESTADGDGLKISGNQVTATKAGTYGITACVYNTDSGLESISSGMRVTVLPQADIVPSTGNSSGTTASVVTPTLSSTQGNGQTGVLSTNLTRHSYSVKSASKLSYLVEATNGYQRVECISKTLVVEDYNDAFQLTGTRTIPLELNNFVAFYEGSQHFFILFSGSNSGESDNVEVARIVKYTKDWERISSTSVKGVYTKGDIIQADMVENNGNLLVHTCRTQYKSTVDGLNHQSNISFTIDIASMSLLSAAPRHVSHSFDQQVATNNAGITVTSDHGDGHPRAIELNMWDDNMIDSFIEADAEVLKLVGETGQNATHAQVGGMEIGSSAVILAGASYPQITHGQGVYNVFVTSTPLSNFSTEASSIQWLTNYVKGGDAYATNPHLVKLSEDKFVVLWNEHGQVKVGTTTDYQNRSLSWAIFNGSGKQVGATQTTQGDLSEVVPIYTNDGTLLWYVTGEKEAEPRGNYIYTVDSAPLFYSLNLETGTLTTSRGSISDSSGGSSDSSDNNSQRNEPSDWAVPLIQEANNLGILNGLSDITAKYQSDITREEFCRLIVNVYESTGRTALTGANPFTDTTNSAVVSAYLMGIVSGKSETTFAPHDKVTREELAVMAMRTVELFSSLPLIPDTADFSDFHTVSPWAETAVVYAQMKGILAGSNGKILPQDNLTCEEAIAVALRVTQQF